MLQTSLGVAMAGADPKATDAALLGFLKQQPSLSVTLKERPVNTDYGMDWIKEGYEVTGDPTVARAAMEIALMPMPPRECIELLTELKATTVQRAEQAHDIRGQMAIYAKKLSAYPADIVRKVLTTQAERSRWWPTWFELLERINDIGQDRALLKKAMQ
jgi:hypothetical protein